MLAWQGPRADGFDAYTNLAPSLLCLLARQRPPGSLCSYSFALARKEIAPVGGPFGFDVKSVIKVEGFEITGAGTIPEINIQRIPCDESSIDEEKSNIDLVHDSSVPFCVYQL